MKLNALLVDPAVLGDEAWSYLERLCETAARPRHRRLHRPLDRGPARARPAARDRRLDHQAVPSRGGDRTGRSRLPAPPPRPPRAETERDDRRRAGDPPRPFQAFVKGDSLDLTRREFELLQLLAAAKGQVLERETIYQRVWGYAMAHGDRSVDVFIRKLRQKLEKRSSAWSYIHTHFGVGYRFDPEPAGIVEETLVAAEEQVEPAPAGQDLHRSFTRASPRGNRGAARRGHAFRSWRSELSIRSQLAAGRLEIRPEEHAALVDGRPLEPDDAGAAAARHPGRPSAADHDPRGTLHRGLGERARHDDRSVDVYVSRLRAKLGEALPDTEADPHPQRDRLPLLARRLRQRPHGPFTSFSHPRYTQVTSWQLRP